MRVVIRDTIRSIGDDGKSGKPLKSAINLTQRRKDAKAQGIIGELEAIFLLAPLIFQTAVVPEGRGHKS
jgi:hypothetical protein